MQFSAILALLGTSYVHDPDPTVGHPVAGPYYSAVSALANVGHCPEARGSTKLEELQRRLSAAEKTGIELV